MIRNTFCHIPRISLRREAEFWNNGIHSWQDLLDADSLPMSKKMRDHLINHLEESAGSLQQGDSHYFADGLATKEHWRLFPDFRHSMAYLDIETTGMDSWNHAITTIALYDGSEIHTYIQGENLPEFKRDIRKYEVIVSYNGKCFDVPFLQNYFQFHIDHAHIDLRYVLKSLGYSGGLKSCERQMGISRHDLEGVGGAFAVLLWREYERTQNLRALETLLAYNIQDVLSLEVLLAEAYNLKILNTPFKVSHRLPIPVSPAIPYSPDVELIERLKEENQWEWE
jgi:uncharacterized protein YprB with RNaseH-like and TPR domain